MKKEKSTNARWWIIAVCAIRILGALYILVNPFWGLIISLFLDYLDSIVLMDYAGFSFREYQKVDKRIDWTTYPFMLIAATRVGYYDIFLGLLLFRLVGQIMFEILKNERVLLVFPNVFENFVIVCLLLFGMSKKKTLDIKPVQKVLMLSILIIPKVTQEYFQHFLDRQLWEIYSFGSWLGFQGMALYLVNPFLWGILLYAVSIGGFLLYIRRTKYTGVR